LAGFFSNSYGHPGGDDVFGEYGLNMKFHHRRCYVNSTTDISSTASTHVLWQTLAKLGFMEEFSKYFFFKQKNPSLDHSPGIFLERFRTSLTSGGKFLG
jgi:hypothetical protein